MAAPSTIVWDSVVSIKAVGREQVYDIEVEGTHNFVANGILAHNTYLKGATADSTAAALNVVNSAATSALYVRNDGNVGIGTTSPGAKLHVYGSAGNVVRFGNATYISADSSSGAYGIIGGSPSPSAIYLDGNNTVGIGAASPAASTRFYVHPGGFSRFGNNCCALDTTASYGHVSIGNGPFDGSTSGYFAGSAGGTALAINTASSFTGNLFDAQSAGASRLVVTSTGNVGIGTTAPAAKLQVAGGAMAVDADQKVSLKGAASSNDTYVTYSSAEGKAWFYVNGQKVAWFKD